MNKLLAENKKILVVIVLVIALIGSSLAIFLVSDATKPDLNSNAKLINEDYLSIWNGTDRVLWRSGVINSTSDTVVSIVFWVNVSQYTNLQFVRFLYFNATHGEYYNSSESISNHNSWNYQQWWTNWMFFTPDEFNTTDPSFVRGYTIPRQSGNTNVTFQLALAQWNGTALVFQEYNGTYSVMFSNYEVWFAKEVHMTTGVYYAISCILFAFGLCIITFLSLKKTEDIQTPTLENPYSPDISFLIERSNHMDETKNNLRTGASILLTLGASSIIWIGNISATFSSLLILGFVSLAFCSFSAIALTFTSIKVQSDGFELGPTLIPTGQTSSLYIEQLKKVIIEKQKVIGRIQSAIGIGLLYLGTSALVGLLLGMLPNAWAIIQNTLTMIPYWIVIGLVFVDAILLSYALFGPKGMKLLSFYED